MLEPLVGLEIFALLDKRKQPLFQAANKFYFGKKGTSAGNKSFHYVGILLMYEVVIHLYFSLSYTRKRVFPVRYNNSSTL